MPRDLNTRDALLVVLTLIASVTFQAGVNPPGGVWQEYPSPDLAPPPAATTINTNPHLINPKDAHKPGKSILANDRVPYGLYLFCNTAAFSTSVYMIGTLLKVSGNGNGRQASGNGNGPQARNGNVRQASGNGNRRQAEVSGNGNGPRAGESENFKAPGNFKLLVQFALSLMMVTYSASVMAVMPEQEYLNISLLFIALVVPLLLLCLKDYSENNNN